MALDYLKLKLSQNIFNLSKNNSKNGPKFSFTLFSPLPLPPSSFSLHIHTDTERALNSISNSRNFSAFSCPWVLLPVLKVIILESFWESFSFYQYNLEELWSASQSSLKVNGSENSSCRICKPNQLWWQRQECWKTKFNILGFNYLPGHIQTPKCEELFMEQVKYSLVKYCNISNKNNNSNVSEATKRSVSYYNRAIICKF